MFVFLRMFVRVCCGHSRFKSTTALILNEPMDQNNESDNDVVRLCLSYFLESKDEETSRMESTYFTRKIHFYTLYTPDAIDNIKKKTRLYSMRF